MRVERFLEKDEYFVSFLQQKPQNRRIFSWHNQHSSTKTNGALHSETPRKTPAQNLFCFKSGRCAVKNVRFCRSSRVRQPENAAQPLLACPILRVGVLHATRLNASAAPCLCQTVRARVSETSCSLSDGGQFGVRGHQPNHVNLPAIGHKALQQGLEIRDGGVGHPVGQQDHHFGVGGLRLHQLCLGHLQPLQDAGPAVGVQLENGIGDGGSGRHKTGLCEKDVCFGGRYLSLVCGRVHIFHTPDCGRSRKGVRRLRTVKTERAPMGWAAWNKKKDTQLGSGKR